MQWLHVDFLLFVFFFEVVGQKHSCCTLRSLEMKNCLVGMTDWFGGMCVACFETKYRLFVLGR